MNKRFQIIFRRKMSLTPTCSSGQAANSASATSFSGSLPIRRFSSAPVFGPSSDAMNYTKQLQTINSASAGSAWSANRFKQANANRHMLNASSRVFQDYKTLRHLLSFLIGLIFIYQIGYGQQTKTEAYKILGISVEGANAQTGTDPGAIIANSGLKTGDEITVPGDQIRQAIQRLWALRIFSDIQVLIENKVEDGVYLLIKVAEYTPFARVEHKGPDDVGRIVRNIKKLYEDEGHLLAEITTETVAEDTGKPNHVILKVLVDEGPSISIGQIHFAGNT